MSHTHHCKVCRQPVAVCDGDTCPQEHDHYCSAHHPDPEHHVTDPPTIRMTVKVAPDDKIEAT